MVDGDKCYVEKFKQESRVQRTQRVAILNRVVRKGFAAKVDLEGDGGRSHECIW